MPSLIPAHNTITEESMKEPKKARTWFRTTSFSASHPAARSLGFDAVL